MCTRRRRVVKLRQRFKPKLTTTTTTTTVRPPAAAADASSDSANEIPDLAANEVSDHQGGKKSFGDKIRHSFSFFLTLCESEKIFTFVLVSYVGTSATTSTRTIAAANSWWRRRRKR